MKKRTSKKKAASKKVTPKSATGADKARTQASLFSDIPAAHQLRQSEFLQHVQDGHRFAHIGRKRPFCFILGAGASFQSGIPTAGTLVDEWLRDIYSRASSPLRLEDWATAENLEITGFSYAHRNEYYSAIFDLRFRGHEEDGTLFLQEKMKGVQPSYGYAVLAQLLGDVHNVVITTNFDSLASDAMFLFGGEAPFICGHERMADYIPEHSNRPVIVKIHRDLLTGPINSRKGTAHLNDAWHEPVKRLLQRYIPIFIGYGGNDGSLMQFLSDLPEDTPERVYWCHYKHDTLSSQVVTYLNGKNRYLVPIDGFDQLMQSVHGVLGLPDLIQMLKEKNEDRLASLRTSLDKLTATAQADVVKAEKSDGKNSPDALTARFNYAKALYEQGRYAEAEQEHRAVLQLRGRVLGAEHPDTLSSRNNVANAMDEQGRYAEAEKEHRAVLQIRERVLGVDHPDTLRSRNNLATALQAQGRYVEAEKAHRAVLLIQERVLGEKHSDTLMSRTNLATALQAQGRHAEAEKEHRSVLQIQESTLGAEHHDTLSSLLNLANSLASQGRYTKAEQKYRDVLLIMERVLGVEHPDALKCRMSIANTLHSQCRHTEAEHEYRAVLQIQERVLGVEHPNTLGSRMNLTGVLYDQGSYSEAEQEYLAVLQIQQRILGSEHPETLASRMGVANAAYSQGRHTEAEQEYRAMLQIMERVLGAEHPDTLGCRMNLALNLASQGRPVEAEQEHREVLQIQQRVLHAEHPILAQSCHNLALCLETQNKLHEALKLVQLAEQLWLKVLGADHQYTKAAIASHQRISAALS